MFPATVTISRALLEILLAEPVVVEEPPPPPFALHREVTLVAEGGNLAVNATWRVAVPAPGEVAWILAGPEVTVERVWVDGVATPVRGNLLLRHFERPATIVCHSRGLGHSPTISVDNSLTNVPELFWVSQVISGG